MPINFGLILYFGTASIVANAALVFAPLLISGLVSSYQFSQSEAVFVIATELLASAFSAVPALWWVSKISWRGVSIVSLLALVLLNLISTLLADFTYLAILRGIGGFFSGTLLILYMVVIATLPDTERIFSGKLVVQLLFSALGMALLPFVIAQFGVGGVYFILAVLGLLLMMPKNVIPKNSSASAHKQFNGAACHSVLYFPRNNILILVALFVFAMGTSIIWSALVPMGEYEGISLADTGWVLSAATVSSIVGGFLCTFAGTRYGRVVPISIGLFMGAAGAILLMFSSTNMVYFLLGSSLICIARVVTIPYLVGLMAVFNQFGHLAILSHVALATGMALGSYVVSLLMTHVSLYWLPILTLFCMVLTAIVLVSLKRPVDQDPTFIVSEL
jgi:MFS family permease